MTKQIARELGLSTASDEIDVRTMQGSIRVGVLSLKKRPNAFLAALAAVFLLPAMIPGMNLDYPYFFILAIVLMAWFTMKWDAYRHLQEKGERAEVVMGLGLILADYAENAYLHSTVGLVDLLILLSGVVLVTYGFHAFKLFWVPIAYGVVLLLGYQIENNIPNYVVLQDWMAGLMASSMRVLGVSASVTGHIVALNSGTNTLLLSVESDCTGIQGVLAFGVLSTMTLLDAKPKKSRLIPLFVIGFAGVFAINILRLLIVFLTFEYVGVSIGTTMHLMAGYLLFVVWVLAFWSFAFRYLTPGPARAQSSIQ